MPDLLVTDAKLLDLETGSLHPDEDTLHVDAAGRTLMPGLIDAHVHAGLTTLDLGALATRPATRLGIETKTVLEGMLGGGALWSPYALVSSGRVRGPSGLDFSEPMATTSRSRRS